MEGDLTLKTMSEHFQEAFPIYLAMGMSYEEFWDKESWLVKAYRKAYRIKQDESNHRAWLEGLYFLQALRSGVPVMVRGFMKSHTESFDYPQRPYDFEEKKQKESQDEQKKKQIAKMREMAEIFNKSFRKKHDANKE